VLTFDLDFGDILAVARIAAPNCHHFPSAKSDARRREPAVISRDQRLRERNGKWCNHHRRGPRISRPAITDSTLRGLGRAWVGRAAPPARDPSRLRQRLWGHPPASAPAPPPNPRSSATAGGRHSATAEK
jgi:hypothetical protein